jgi:hypothetical protein
MTTDQSTAQHSADAAAADRVDPVVMWGNLEVTRQSGPMDFSDWSFGNIPPPWMYWEKGKLMIVSPDWDLVDGEWECLEAAVDFMQMIQNYKDTFLSNNCDTEENMEKEKMAAIKALEKAIDILAST